MKDPINKDVTDLDLKEIFEQIKVLNSALNQLGLDIFNEETKYKRLSKISHFVFAIIHRAIELNRGFLTLSESNNWITAVSLIRLQADNCMRFHALNLVEDKVFFYNQVTSGVSIRDIKDSKGNKMWDGYLATELDKLFPFFKTIYNNTSGLIHFSEEHIKIGSDLYENKDNPDKDFLLYIRFSESREFPIYEKVDYAFNMHQLGKLLYQLIHDYKIVVIKIMKQIEKESK